MSEVMICDIENRMQGGLPDETDTQSKSYEETKNIIDKSPGIFDYLYTARYCKS